MKNLIATLDGRILEVEVPDEPTLAEPAVPTLESLAAAVQVIAERVGMTKAEAETLVRPPPVTAPPERA
jgi:hypothetical protein